MPIPQQIRGGGAAQLACKAGAAERPGGAKSLVIPARESHAAQGATMIPESSDSACSLNSLTCAPAQAPCIAAASSLAPSVAAAAVVAAPVIAAAVVALHVTFYGTACAAEPTLVVPAVDVPLRIALPLPPALKYKPGQPVQLEEPAAASQPIAAQLAPAIADDGTVDSGGAMLLAVIPPVQAPTGAKSAWQVIAPLCAAQRTGEVFSASGLRF